MNRKRWFGRSDIGAVRRYRRPCKALQLELSLNRGFCRAGLRCVPCPMHRQARGRPGPRVFLRGPRFRKDSAFQPVKWYDRPVGRLDDVNEQICDIFHSDKPPAVGKVPRTRGAQGPDHYVIGKRGRFFPGRPLRRARFDPVGNWNGTPKATSQLLLARRGGPRSGILAYRLTRAQSWTVGRAWLDGRATLEVALRKSASVRGTRGKPPPCAAELQGTDASSRCLEGHSVLTSLAAARSNYWNRRRKRS